MNEDGRISINAESRDAEFWIRVSDNGRGIEKEKLEKIWTPFFTTKGNRGTGIGLDISRRIIEGHGGSIACESVPGRGAAFIFNLPRAGS